MIHRTLGDRLKYSLEIRHIQQRDFAKRLGITEATMSRYINDQRLPRADTIVDICNELGVSADWLLGMIER